MIGVGLNPDGQDSDKFFSEDDHYPSRRIKSVLLRFNGGANHIRYLPSPGEDGKAQKGVGQILIHGLKNEREPDRLHPMKKYLLNFGTICLILIIPICLSTIVHGNDSGEIPTHYQPLIERLSKDGFDFEFLSKL